MDDIENGEIFLISSMIFAAYVIFNGDEIGHFCFYNSHNFTQFDGVISEKLQKKYIF